MFQSHALPPLIRGLLDASAYPHEARRVQLVQTHISYVLLAGHFAYKIKKPLDLGFLDYSTLERRQRMCEEEVRLNRRLCTGVYLGVVPITRDGERYTVGGVGPAVEYAVQMRRVPSERMLSSLLSRGEVTPAHIRSLARTVAAFHEHAETSEAIAALGGVGAVRANWKENFDQVQPFVGRYVSAADFERIEAYVAGFLTGAAALIDHRAELGRTRDVHGDLRADSVVFDGERATCIMDCIEFDPLIRYGDIASDVAFLMMDLDARGYRSFADEFAAFYMERAIDETLPCVIPFYECYRAVVRAKVHGIESAESDVPESQRAEAGEAARLRFQLALRYAQQAPDPPVVVVMCGLTGSGKSFVANAFAARIGAAAITSDAVRIEMLGSHGAPIAADSAGPYTEERRAAVYAEMRRRARVHLNAGRSVVLDATHERRADRDLSRDLARECGASFMILLVETREDVVRARLEARAAAGGSISGGTWDVYQAQQRRFEAPAAGEPVHRFASTAEFATDLDAIQRALSSVMPGRAQ